MWAMIGQFSGPNFTEQPAEFRGLCELKSSPSILTQWCSKYLT